MSVIRVEHQKNYVVIKNDTVLTDPTLSWKAKGIWAYAMSRPDDWQFHVSQLEKVSKDGKDSIYSGLKELEKAGYLRRAPKTDEKGKYTGVDYVISEIKIILPQRDFPDAGNPTVLSIDSLPSIDNSPPYPPKEGSGCGAKAPGTGAFHAEEEEAKRKIVSLRLEMLTMKEEGKPNQKFTKRERERFLRTYSLDHLLDCLNAISTDHDMSKVTSLRAILITEFEKDPSRKGSKHV